MKKIRFLQNYGRHLAGHVIGTTDSSADSLVNSGIAQYEADSVRPFKYAPNAQVQSECIMPVIEEMEAAPKGAIWGEEIETAVAAEEYEKPTTTYKQKQLKK